MPPAKVVIILSYINAKNIDSTRFLAFIYFLGVMVISNSSFALDLKTPDRLKTPAKHYSHIENTAFLSLQRISNRIVAVGDRGVIAFSDNEGVSWQQSDVPISTLMTSVHFPNETEGWAVGHGGSILYTADRAQSWKLQLDGRQVNQLLLQKAKDTLQKLKEDYAQADEYQKQDLQYAVEDAEYALSNAEFDVGLGPANPFLDVLFLNEKKGFAVGAYGLFVVTEDGGQTWISAASRLENFDRYHLNTLAQLKGGAIIIAGEAGTLFASYDQGLQWETLYGPYQGSFFGIQPTESKDEALLYGLKGHVFKTQDAGQSWKSIPVSVETSLTSSAISQDGELVISGYSGVVLLSNDHGESFSRIKTKGFEGFNGVEFTRTGNFVLVSNETIQTLDAY
tara:strand:- start:11893 stop:13077 length:1185 start_codon:yes stop_codon:yes gene_type:complete